MNSLRLKPQGSFLPKYQNPELMLAVKFHQVQQSQAIYRTLKCVPLFSSSIFLTLRKSSIFEGETVNLLWVLNSQQRTVVLPQEHSSVNLQTQGMRIQSLGDAKSAPQSHRLCLALPCTALPCTNVGWRDEWRDEGQTPSAALLCTAGPRRAWNLHSAG